MARGKARPPGLLLIGALYISQGVPLGFAFEALPVLLRDAGVPLDVLAWLPLAGIPWIAKFLWAPIVDNCWFRRIGRRRTWILAMQSLLIVTMLLLATLPFSAEMAPWLLAVLVLGIVFAATQDTATDGLAAGSLHGVALARANGLQIGGMMVGFMVGGAGLLLLAEAVGHVMGLTVLAAVLAAALLPVLFWEEPEAMPAADRRAQIRNTLRRPGAWLLIAISLAGAAFHAGGQSLSRLVLVDAGWSPGAVGAIGLLGGTAMIVLGAPVAARLVARIGIWQAAVVGLAVVGLAFLLWIRVAAGETASAFVYAAIVVLGAGGGIVSVAFSTLAMRFAGTSRQEGTDVTVLQSAFVLGETLSSAGAVGIAAATGYRDVFLIGLATLACSLLLVRWIGRRPAAGLYFSREAA